MKQKMIMCPFCEDKVSSRFFREKLHRNDKTARELVTQEVWEIMNENGNTVECDYRFPCRGICIFEQFL